MQNEIPDFANASSVQGIGLMVAEWAATVEARLAGSTSAPASAPAAEAPAEAAPADASTEAAPAADTSVAG